MNNSEENKKMASEANTCCSESVNQNSESNSNVNSSKSDNKSVWLEYFPSILSFILLAIALVIDHLLKFENFKGIFRMAWYIGAYIPVGIPVIRDAIKSIIKGSYFSEYFLMSIATIGAFFINQYSEGVAVMLFYAIGELFQSAAVNKAKRSIKALLDIRPEIVNVKRNGIIIPVAPTELKIGEIFQVKAGEKIALDGELISQAASLNTSALTGESKPDYKKFGESVYSGMINLNSVIEIKVTSLFNDSKLSKILELVQEATAHKAPTQLFISKFAKIYTPIVVFLAIGICTLPMLFMTNYVFQDWLYRSLVFLVISCPCALVISIPLGYFGGIGLASRNGILFKGSNYLDLISNVKTIVLDKTGTLTKGVFTVQNINPIGISENELLQLAASIEENSTHPIALAVVKHASKLVEIFKIEDVEEIPGHGLKGLIKGNILLAGNLKLLNKYGVKCDHSKELISDTVIYVAFNNNYIGNIIISDEIKEDSIAAIKEIQNLNINTVILSGDNQIVVDKVARQLNIDNAFGNLLPESKVEKVKELISEDKKLAFVGDGINDAPVIALADVGIAMGGLGSDAAIETADVVIQNDQPSKIVTAIKIGRITRKIVWQNIGMAMGVKIIVLLLGATGNATLWEAVFADVGVALLAILNAVRIQRIHV